nr:MAG TPA: hypothetical protein [Caudoviricetes sp.]
MYYVLHTSLHPFSLGNFYQKARGNDNRCRSGGRNIRYL